MYEPDDFFYGDADIETAQLQERARREDALKRRGVCTHGAGWWTRIGEKIWEEKDRLVPIGGARCNGCGRIFETEQDLIDDRNDKL